MPPTTPTKKRCYSSDSDSGSEDKRSDKKQKVQPEANLWNIGRNRYVKLSEVKGQWYVNIRHFYAADGELTASKKGIMLTMDQWHKFKSVIPEIEEAVKNV